MKSEGQSSPPACSFLVPCFGSFGFLPLLVATAACCVSRLLALGAFVPPSGPGRSLLVAYQVMSYVMSCLINYVLTLSLGYQTSNRNQIKPTLGLVNKLELRQTPTRPLAPAPALLAAALLLPALLVACCCLSSIGPRHWPRIWLAC